MHENHTILHGKRFDLELERFYGNEPSECAFGHRQIWDEETEEWYCPECEWIDTKKGY